LVVHLGKCGILSRYVASRGRRESGYYLGMAMKPPH
jgi:hypothetical protein